MFLLVAVHAPIDTAAQALASAAILQPLEAVTILFATLGSVIFLGETMTLIDIKGSILITMGSLISVAFGVHIEQPLNNACVEQLLYQFVNK